MSSTAKRLAFFIPLAASVPLWVGALPQLPSAGLVSPHRLGAGDSDGQARIEDLPIPIGRTPVGGPAAEADETDRKSLQEIEMIVPLQAVAPGGPLDGPAASARPVPRPAEARPHAAPRIAQRPAPRMRKVRMLVTGYCPCRECCRGHSDNITASGRSIYANDSRFVAADTRVLPFGTRVSVPGYYSGAPVSVLDRGGRIKGHRLDVFFLSHEQARRWGLRWLDVIVYQD